MQKIADAAGIGNSRYNAPSEVLVHPQLTARDRWRAVETSAGPIQGLLLLPPVIAGYDPPMGAVPGLGQHTDLVLEELGIGADEVVAFRDRGVIGRAQLLMSAIPEPVLLSEKREPAFTGRWAVARSE